MKDQGETELHGSRDAIRLAFRRGLLQNGEIWMDMLQDRIRTTHTYDERGEIPMTGQYGLKDDVIRQIHAVLERYPQVQEAPFSIASVILM